MENNLDTTKPLYSERILPVFWPFVTSSLYCILSWKALLRVLPPKLSPTYLATNQVLQDAWIQTSDWLKLRGRHAIQGVKSFVKKKLESRTITTLYNQERILRFWCNLQQRDLLQDHIKSYFVRASVRGYLGAGFNSFWSKRSCTFGFVARFT